MKVKLKSKREEEDIISLICENRGLSKDNLVDFLNPTRFSLYPPETYKNMIEVADSILIAISMKKRIGILVDSDTDGFCSSAMLINYFREATGYEGFIILHHREKSHGLTDEIMEEIYENNIEVIITPDSSSNDYEQHEELYKAGVEVLVIDHHKVDRESKFAKVLNNQLNLFGNKTLSGGGMVMKVLEYLDSKLGINMAPNFYDLASVALVGDSMLINNPETRYYVSSGLININNPLLAELYRADKPRTVESISYDVAPTINAFIRVATFEEKKDLFRALIGFEDMKEISIRGAGTFELALPEYIARLGTRVKTKQTNEVKRALESPQTKIIHENLPFTICLLDEQTNKSLTGLIGNKLTEIYNKPAIVLKEYNDCFAGSGRTTNTFDNFKSYINGLNIFAFAQGHEGAFGCSILKDKLQELLVLIAGTSLSDESEYYVVDKSYVDWVSAFDVLSVAELNPYWSKGFEKPKFHIKLTGLLGNEVEIVGNKKDTIRFKHNNITYIKFKCEPDEIARIKNCTVNEVELVGSFDANNWMDRIYPQVHIEELEFDGHKNAFNFQNYFS